MRRVDGVEDDAMIQHTASHMRVLAAIQVGRDRIQKPESGLPILLHVVLVAQQIMQSSSPIGNVRGQLTSDSNIFRLRTQRRHVG